MAGYVDEEGTLTDLFGPGVVRIFDRRSGVWRPVKDIGFTLEGTAGLGQMRTKLHGLAEAMKDCKVLLLREVKGVLPALLGERGVAVSQVSGNALERLAEVFLESEEEIPAVDQQTVPVEPVEGDPGIFRIDLAAALRDSPRLTSRQVLLPLLTKRGFTLLEVLCDHPPRWLDSEGRRMGFGYESAPRENARDGFVVTIYPDAESSNCGPGGEEGCPSVFGSGGCSSGCSSPQVPGYRQQRGCGQGRRTD
jgi:Fe-only nitrogenase accessory protein AnfO